MLKNKIVKTCKKCGDLTEEQVYRRPNRPTLECLACMRESTRRSREKHREKRLAEDRIRLKIERPISTTHLYCGKCKAEKPVAEFNKYMINLKHPRCKICTRQDSKKSHAKPASKEKHKKWYNQVYEPLGRNSYYKRKYGITLEEYNSLALKQNNLCASCGETEKTVLRQDGKIHLHVDHCHVTNKVRGLLCSQCNRGIGHFYDSPQKLQMAIDYLKKSSLSFATTLVVVA